MLSSEEKDQVQLYRLMSLLGAILIPAFGLLYRGSYPEAVNPAWAQYGLSALFAGLFGASYLSRGVRRRYVPLMWILLYVQMGWITAVAALNRFGNEHALGMLLVYASIGVVIELGSRSFRPILWFLATGFLIAATGLSLTPAPQTAPAILLGVMGAVALTIGFSVQGRLSIRAALTDREKRLDERRRKLESLYEATSRLLEADRSGAVSNHVHEVLRAVFDYPLNYTGFLEGDLIVPADTTTDASLRGPNPSPQPMSKDTVSARALRAGDTVVIEDVGTLDNDIDYGEVISAAGVPIGDHGAIVLGRADGRDFDGFNLRLIEVLADYAALVLGRLERETALKEAKDAAEEAVRLKSAMLANMSHEIRTPLTSIIGFSEAIGEEVETLEDGPDEASLARLDRFATLIEQGGTRLLDTLDGVLNLSRLEAEQMELTAEPVDLADQAVRIADELGPTAAEKGLDLEVRTDDAPAMALADGNGVQIVLQNLVSNAIKYTDEGGAEVRAYQNGEAAVLEVEDSGIGMASEMAEDLFEPFRQASEGLAREYEGTGIGLAVTKEAVEQMGGTLDVETEKGVGSCFTVRLPVAEEASRPPNGTDPSPPRTTADAAV
jgi:signal transduction histidine kinase